MPKSPPAPHSASLTSPASPALPDRLAVIEELHVFVYGTLRAGECNDIAAAALRHGLTAPRLLGPSRIRGALFDFGPYPGLLPVADQGWVLGDIYCIDRSLLPVLDGIEGIGATTREAFYRAACQVVWQGTLLACEYYPVDAHSVEGLMRIASGDWVAHRRGRGVRAPS